MFKSEQNPFSVYDFLGYFIPGATFLLAIDSCPLAPALVHAATTTAAADSETKAVTVFVLASYMTGHFLSFLSSFLIERYCVWRYGYPSKYLLGLPSPAFWERDGNGCIIVRRNALRAIVSLLILPVALLDVLVDWGFGREHVKALDTRLADGVKASLSTLLGNDAVHRDSDFLRSAYHVAVEQASAHLPKMQNYVALYGFVRVSCFSLVLISWLLAIAVRYRGMSPWWPATTIALAFVFYLAFIKFYRRFSLEALMAIHALVLIRRWEIPSKDSVRDLETAVPGNPTG